MVLSKTTRSMLFYKNRKEPTVSFYQFLEAIENNFYDIHVEPQYSFLYPKGISIDEIDFILDFDHLEQDLRIFFPKVQDPSKKRSSCKSWKSQA